MITAQILHVLCQNVCCLFKEKPLSKSLQRGEDPQFDQVSLYYNLLMTRSLQTRLQLLSAVYHIFNFLLFSGAPQSPTGKVDQAVYNTLRINVCSEFVQN